jgi:hypothetical protein
MLNIDFNEIRGKKFKLPGIISCENYESRYADHSMIPKEYPLIYPGWDNTPRSGKDGWLFEKSSPRLFHRLCTKAFEQTENKSDEEKIVILKSWNEWTEGNFLEPDSLYGHQYLQAFRGAIQDYENRKSFHQS